ncbi:hypothetical protein F3D3_2778 [Fusibacter sp. 3D3]|nr:hypothetical protein F3D3_2778 [Fusibacter sp. 3D3]
MKTLYLDCFAGISGDMFMGAMVDLGVDFEMLKSELSKLGLDHEFDIEMRRDSKLGIFGTKVDVIDHNHLSHSHEDHNDAHEHSHEHKHAHEHLHEHVHSHEADHSHGHAHQGHNGHTHEAHHDHKHAHTHDHDQLRNFGEIKKIIQKSSLSERVKGDSLKIFELIAKAEAKIHGKAVDEVHFHEVGAIDSIVDVIGAAICMALLEIDTVLASPIEVGDGFVKCAHGKMPVPAPATAEILIGAPTLSKVKGYEMTTPTGAAIISAFVTDFPENKRMKAQKIGYGMGTRNLEIPNCLRAIIVEDQKNQSQWIIETNIDDMSSEQLVFAEERLFAVGALDVYKTAIIMKKGRPAIKMTILAKTEDIEALQKILFTETTSIGLRKYSVDKVMLDRAYQQVETQYGSVTIKTALLEGKIVNQKPEYEECKRLALENQVTLSEIYKTVNEALMK